MAQQALATGPILCLNLKKFENGIHYDTYDNLLASEEIQTLYDTEINSLISSKNGFKMFERVNKFTLIQKPFEVGVELSAKQEMMRHKIVEKYSDIINTLFEN